MVKAKEIIKAIDDVKDIFGNSFKTADQSQDIEYIPTDIDVLNNEIYCCGGIPRGHVIEIAGKPHTGKSTFCQWHVGQVQKAGGVACWFDAEKTFKKSYATGSGIILEELILPTFGHGEDLLYKIKLAIASNAFDIVVLDCQDVVKPGVISKAKIASLSMNEKMERSKMWADFWRSIINGYEITNISTGKPVKSNKETYEVKTTKKGIKEVKTNLLHSISQKKTTLYIISHLGDRPGVIYGKKQDTSGGEEQKFAFSLRIWLNRQMVRKQVKGSKIVKHSLLTLKVEKNKLGFLGSMGGKCEIKMTNEGALLPLSADEKEEIDIFNEEDELDIGVL